MITDLPLSVKFWGTRASYPFFLPTHQRLGGDTSCVQLSCGQSQVFIDAGTGLMHAEPSTGHDVVVLSHFHLDHVLGLPYFLGKKKQGTLTLASATCTDEAELRFKINSVYGGAGFPVSLSLISPHMQWVAIEPSGLRIDGWNIQTSPLNHPGGGSGYRISHEQANASVVYLSDHEHGTEKDEALARFAHGAGLVIWDSSYDDRNFAPFKGWGHSTWQEGVRFYEHCQARALALTHHDPSRDDASAAEIELQLTPSSTFLAHDRLVLPQVLSDLTS